MNLRSVLTVLLLGAGAVCADEPKPAEGGAVKLPAPPSFSVTGDLDEIAPEVVGRLVQEYTHVAPQMFGRFWQKGKPLPEKVEIHFDKALKIPAHASGQKITIGTQWMKRQPDDTAVITHELMHVVQAYPPGQPGWLVEGIADYIRYLYGAKQASWQLPTKFGPKNHYKEGYRTTARFLQWVEETHPGTVDALNGLLQSGKYTPTSFNELTKSSPEDLWTACAKALDSGVKP